MAVGMGMEVVRIYTDGSEGEEIGYFMKCNDCGELQLIARNKKKCKKCRGENLMWVKEDMIEVTPEEVENIGYDLEFVI